MRDKPIRSAKHREVGGTKHGTKRLVAPTLIFLTAALLYLTGGLRFLDDKLLEARFAVFERKATSDLVVVAVDPESIKDLGTWPWPRDYHARVLETLLEAGANRVAFDVDFSSASNAEGDARFADALRLAGQRVILPVFKQRGRGEAGEKKLILTAPLPAFRDTASLASVALQPDADGVVRRAPTAEPWGDGAVPFLAHRLAGVDGGAGSAFYIDFGIVPDTISEIPYAEVLENRFDPSRVAGKNVIVGATAIELSDYLTVPRWGVLAGVRVLGLAYQSVVQGRSLHRLGPLAVLALTLAAAIAFGSRCARWNWRRSFTLLAVTWAAIAALGLAAHHFGLVLDSAVMVLATGGFFLYGIIVRTNWQALRLLKQRLELRYKDTLMEGIVQNSFDAILILDESGRIDDMNPAAQEMFGDDGGSLAGRHIGDVIPRALNLTVNRNEGGAPHAGTQSHELTARRLDHSEFPAEIVVREMATEDRRWHIAFVRDITERKAHQEALEYQALHDVLTGLPNRTLLHKRLSDTIGRALRTGDQFALLLLDLNRFKEVNDTLGHHIGDLLLEQIGRRLSVPLRKTDMIARLGGDEFAIVLPAAADRSSVIAITERLHETLEEPLQCSGLALNVGASIGVALFPRDGTDVTELIQKADVAMYLAKNAGLPMAFYDRERDHNSVRHLTLSGELKRAIEGEHLDLYYQPKISIASQEVIGVEALARWKHPTHGFVPPDEFVALAEQTGLIKGLTAWALRTALQQCARWRSAGLNLDVAVNLSAKLLHDLDLPRWVVGLLARYDLEPERLVLEITESAIMADPVRAKTVVEALTEKGVRVSIDDFGTGYSSLGYLKELPVHELKIDKSFVMDMTNGENEPVIVKSILDLAHNLGLKVVAEGVETAEILAKLADLRADVAQGYFISRPVPAAEFDAWLRTWLQPEGKPQLVAIAGGAN